MGDKSRPLVVLLPGLGATGLVWTAVIRLVGNDIQYVVLEPKGFGYNPDGRDVTIEDSALDLVNSRLLDGYKLLLVGQSAGALMAMAIAAALPVDQTYEIIGVNGLFDALSEAMMRPVIGLLRHPRQGLRFRALVLSLSTNWHPLMTDRLRRPGHPLVRLAYFPMVWKPSRLTAENLSYLLDGNRAPGIRDFVKANSRHDFLAQLQKLRHRISFLEGAHDPIMTRVGRSRFLRRLPDSFRGVVRTIPATGHMMPFEAPEEVARLIRERLAVVTAQDQAVA